MIEDDRISTRSLSAVLDPHRAAAYDAAVIELGAVRLHLRQPGRALVHLALTGSFVLELDHGEPLAVPPGGCAVVVAGRPHSIADAPGRAPAPFRYFDAEHRIDRLPVLRPGDGAPAARVLTAIRPFEGAIQALLRGLPELLTTGIADGPPAVDPTAAARLVNGRGAAAFALSLADLCFLQAARAALLTVKVPRGASASIYQHPQVSAAVNRINAAPGEDWTVAALAEAVGMSRSAFAAAFRAHVGQAPAAFLAEIRMERAMELLNDRRILISQIARRLGYRSQSSFSRAFRKRYGRVPGDFRAWR